MSTEPQPSVIQWNKVHIDPSRVACSSNVVDTMRDPKEESERTIVIPFNKNTKFSSQDPEYLDVKIEVRMLLCLHFICLMYHTDVY